MSTGYDRLIISGCVEFDSIISFSMQQTAGKHASARLCGILAEKGSQLLTGKLSGEIITVIDKETGKYLPIFEGFVDTIDFITENGLDVAEINLLAGSVLLDFEQKSKSYQDVNLTYEKIISDVLSEFELGDSVVATEMRDMKIVNPIIRYRETAWKFIQRLASHCNLPVFSDVRSSNPRVYVGVPDIRSYKAVFMEDVYTVGGGREYYAAGGPMRRLDKSNFLRYDVQDGNHYFLGWRASFKNRDFHICGKTCRMDSCLLVYGYTLCDRKLYYTPKQYNSFFHGMSLLGRVLMSEKDDVRIQLDIDKTQDVQTAYPWPWVPETGNLMYLMPKIGSRVSLYFGDDDESNGQAINCIRENSPQPPAVVSYTPTMVQTSTNSISFPEPSKLYTGETQSTPQPATIFDLRNNSFLKPIETPKFDFQIVSDVFIDGTFNHNFRSLTTEHNKSIYLKPDNMGFITKKMVPLPYEPYTPVPVPSQELKLTDGKGVSFSTDGEFKIFAGGNVLIEGRKVTISSKDYTYLANGFFMQNEMNDYRPGARPLIFVNQTEIRLYHSPETGLGEIKTGAFETVFTAWAYCSDWDDFKDDPVEQPFNYVQLLANVGKSLVIVVVAAGMVYLTVVSFGTCAGLGGTAFSLAASVFVTGATYVGGQMIEDISKGSVSDFGAYEKAAIIGSAVGLINGLTAMLPGVGQHLLNKAGAAFLSGSGTSAVTQYVETGEIDSAKMLEAGVKSSVAAVIQHGVMKGITALYDEGVLKTACFVAGTPVVTVAGLVPIENIAVGDKVISTNPDTEETAEKGVINIYERETNWLVHVWVCGKETRVTADHPYYVIGKGWTNAGDLVVNEQLRTPTGEVAFIDEVWLETLEHAVLVYNLKVEDFHSYYAGSVSVLVHNANVNYDEEIGGVIFNKKIGDEWAVYVEATQLRRLDEEGLLVCQERFYLLDGSYVIPDYSFYNVDSDLLTIADAKARLSIPYDEQARGFIEIAQSTKSKTIIYYTPTGDIPISNNYIKAALENGVRVLQVGVK